MGNKISGESRKTNPNVSSLRIEEETAPQQFRVHIHRRRKFIVAYLRVEKDQIRVERSKNDVQVWPLQFIRRYGYTSAGVFFFESGRRCPSGEGLYCFQSRNAENIFQLVQQKVRQNANDGAFRRQRSERAQSSGPSLSSARINPVQRYGSEAAAVSDYFRNPSSYHTVNQGSNLRKVPFPQPPRPRSVGGDDETQNAPSSSFYSRRPNKLDSQIAGTIISESNNPFNDDDTKSNAGSERSLPPYRPSYVNINSISSYDYRPRVCSSSGSVQSLISSPPTPTHIVPLKWDAGGGSTNLLCYVQPTLERTHSVSPNITTNSVPSSSNGNQMNSFPNERLMLNYADVNHDRSERPTSRCSSIGRRSDMDSTLSAGQCNYTLIDAVKTNALKICQNLDKANLSEGNRRRYWTGT